jgi:hypothetical protein
MAAQRRIQRTPLARFVRVASQRVRAVTLNHIRVALVSMKMTIIRVTVKMTPVEIYGGISRLEGQSRRSALNEISKITSSGTDGWIDSSPHNRRNPNKESQQQKAMECRCDLYGFRLSCTLGYQSVVHQAHTYSCKVKLECKHGE